VFGAILDRDAGMFRLGPDGVAVPPARRYLPGTMVLETSRGVPGGWIVVRDVLLIGPGSTRTRARTIPRVPTGSGARSRCALAAIVRFLVSRGSDGQRFARPGVCPAANAREILIDRRLAEMGC